MATPKVEKGVPIPDKRFYNHAARAASAYRFDLLQERGDSIFYPAADAKKRKKIMFAAKEHQRRHPEIVMVTRTVEEHGKLGLRVWRTA